jgi:hypothetical protein
MNSYKVVGYENLASGRTRGRRLHQHDTNYLAQFRTALREEDRVELSIDEVVELIHALNDESSNTRDLRKKAALSRQMAWWADNLEKMYDKGMNAVVVAKDSQSFAQ